MRTIQCAGLCLIAASVVMGPASPAVADLNRWTRNGPFGGDVVALAVDPHDPSSVHAGTSSTPEGYFGACLGAFHSVDGGVTWAPRNAGLPAEARCVSALAVDPVTPGVLYAGTGDGIFRSVDGGPWQRRGLGGRWILALTLDPRNPDVLYAASIESAFDESPGGLHRSSDGGATWTELGGVLADPGPFEEQPWIQALAVDPRIPGTLYASAVDHGVFRSSDGGATWTDVSDGLPTSRSTGAFVIDPGTSTVFVATSGGVFRSSDGGPWTPSLSGPPVAWLTADPRDPSSLYALAQSRLYRSRDGGESWVAGAERLHTPLRCLAVQPQDGSALVGTLDAGVFRSSDGGDTWVPSARGLPELAVRRIATTPGEDVTLLWALTRNGVFRSADGGRTWAPRNSGLGGRVRILGSRHLETLIDLVVDPQDPSILYAASGFEAGVFRSLDGGESWEWIGLRFSQIQDLAIASGSADGQSPSILYAAAHRVYRSSDRGETWTESLNAEASGLAVAPSSPATIYAAERKNLWRSLDGGDQWTRVADGRPRFLSLAVDPRDPFTLVAGSELQGIFRSTDGGVSWMRALGDFGDVRVDTVVTGPPVAARPAPDSPPIFYAGTRGRGAYRSVDGGESWWRLPGGLGNAQVESLAIAERASDRGLLLYAVAGQRFYDLGLVPFLELQGGRFRVAVDWREFGDVRGIASVASVAPEPGGDAELRSSDSAVFEFFDPDNWELLIKVLDGRRLNHHFWVFFAATTNVEFGLTVTDTGCQTSKTYINPLGRAAPAVTDTKALLGCLNPGPPSCEADEDTVCLGPDGRFRVEITWRDFTGGSGVGRQARIPGGGLAESGDSGLFYFFGESNWELQVKVLDGCRFNGHFWVFSAATTDVEYRMTVTDTATGEVRTYFNPLRVDALAVTDVEAFATCQRGPSAIF